MRIKQLAFVGAIIVFTIGCFFAMSNQYDDLSRYTYDNEEAKSLIRKYLNKDEIDYIISYAIEPGVFIDYIEADYFNIYRSEIYNNVKSAVPTLSNNDIVKLVEKSLNEISEDELYNYLANYYGHVLVEWFDVKDNYVDAKLISNPSDLLAYVDDHNTVFKQSAANFYEVDNALSADGEPILLAYPTEEHLTNMCAAISSELSIKNCAGLRIEAGLRNYHEEEVYFNEMLEEGYSISDLDYPGHSEHQLGIAIDFTVLNVTRENFAETKQYEWLIEHAHEYGFVQTYTNNSKVYTNKNARENHFRFVGIINAKKMHTNNLALIEVIGE